MKTNEFYARLFERLVGEYGQLDRVSIVSIVGFDCGGPVNLSTIGRESEYVVCVSSELALRDDQQRNSLGNYEVMMICNSIDWAHTILTVVGNMSLENIMDDGHTIDISGVVKETCPIKGIVLEEYSRINVMGKRYGILRLIGITEREMLYARKFGAKELIAIHKQSAIYPKTNVYRKS